MYGERGLHVLLRILYAQKTFPKVIYSAVANEMAKQDPDVIGHS